MILKKYHILVNQILSAKYVEKFIEEIDQNIFTTASRIKSGLNENEVSLVRKSFRKTKVFLKNFLIFLIDLYFTVIFVVFSFIF